MPATKHQHHFEDLSPDDFECLVYWLVKRSGEFDEAQQYGGGSDKCRDVVAYKHTATGREKWYIQCKRYDKITFATLRDELGKLAGHIRANASFAPGDEPPRAPRRFLVRPAGLEPTTSGFVDRHERKIWSSRIKWSVRFPLTGTPIQSANPRSQPTRAPKGRVTVDGSLASTQRQERGRTSPALSFLDVYAANKSSLICAFGTSVRPCRRGRTSS
jgi:hypothetical protein